MYGLSVQSKSYAQGTGRQSIEYQSLEVQATKLQPSYLRSSDLHASDLRASDIQATDLLATVSQPIRYSEPTNLGQKVADYYDIATPGYEDWSSNINMHFGVYEKGLSPFNREAMLENTNRKVLELLALENAGSHILDMGCGVGATARYALKHGYSNKVCGITLCQTQVAQAIDRAAQEGLQQHASFACMDFHNTSFPDADYDGVYAIESACHSNEPDKKSLLKEAFRLLKPGKRIVLCDGFIRNSDHLNPLTEWANKKVCKNWALGCFGDIDKVEASLNEIGYEDIHIENISLKVLPSACFIPWVSFKYLFKLIRTKETDLRYWRHLFAPLWGLGLALDIRHFGYYLVSAKKPRDR
ncbi:MAG: MPBQ/MSBQ methyltransferase [Flavobacteriales bacterium]|jgi:MPBQ/MSBQ methyltransferase